MTTPDLPRACLGAASVSPAAPLRFLAGTDMTYRASDFTVAMTLVALQWAKYSAMATEMQAIATALGSDATTRVARPSRRRRRP